MANWLLTGLKSPESSSADRLVSGAGRGERLREGGLVAWQLGFAFRLEGSSFWRLGGASGLGWVLEIGGLQLDGTTIRHQPQLYVIT